MSSKAIKISLIISISLFILNVIFVSYIKSTIDEKVVLPLSFKEFVDKTVNTFDI